MELRTFVTFEAEFPDDGKFTESGDIERPDGFAIAKVLAQMLRDRGLKVSAPKQYSYYGWAFIATDKDVRIWFLLQFAGPWIVLSQNKTFWLKKLLSSTPSSTHQRFLQVLNDSLTHDHRFQQIKWFTEEEYDKAAAAPFNEGRSAATRDLEKGKIQIAFVDNDTAIDFSNLTKDAQEKYSIGTTIYPSSAKPADAQGWTNGYNSVMKAEILRRHGAKALKHVMGTNA